MGAVLRGERGFTLLEVLVAATIAALSLGVLLQGTVEARRAKGLATRYESATARARSHLAAVSNAGPVVAGDRQGDDGGGYRWRVRIVPLAAATPGGASPVPTLYGVTAAVSWRAERGGEHVVQLETRRLGLAPPQPP